MSRFWSSVVHSLSPYVPGEQPKLDGIIKLNTNENPYGPSPRVLAAITSATDRLRLYPDPRASSLCETIAACYDVASEEVFVGNGSDEVLAHTSRPFSSMMRRFCSPTSPIASTRSTARYMESVTRRCPLMPR
jgi:histidinol-phosphate/aromatic aminotransferase/cobyric acid decarboxylase-like protein